MRRLLLAATLGIGVALSAASPAFADADPTMDQIYEAAKAGHLDQAQTMIDKVLVDHPTSARAHFVQAELYAKEGKTALARTELGTAERLKPGLPDFNPRSVAELKAQLGLSSRPNVSAAQAMQAPERAAPHFPWGTVLILAIVVGVLMMIFRRRPQQYPGSGQYPMGGGPGMGGGPNPGYGPGYGPPQGGGGIGSGIAGGLASGLAVGAGVVAGEELAHHFIDGRRDESGSSIIPSADASDANYNGDMGGNDFGANDPGSWDDGGGSGGGGGGDDWS
jgi:hypothetical protein